MLRYLPLLTLWTLLLVGVFISVVAIGWLIDTFVTDMPGKPVFDVLRSQEAYVTYTTRRLRADWHIFVFLLIAGLPLTVYCIRIFRNAKS
jgi:hypothetical protein